MKDAVEARHDAVDTDRVKTVLRPIARLAD